ncbi:hypothetical protein FRC10_011071, partial [Ceratobasidium sp. 414]
LTLGAEPVELLPPAVPVFLDAVSLVAQSMSETKNQVETLRFLEDVLVVAVTASTDIESKALILKHPACRGLWNTIDYIEDYRSAEASEQTIINLASQLGYDLNGQ